MPGTTLSTQNTPSSHADFGSAPNARAIGIAARGDGVDQPAAGQRIRPVRARASRQWRSRTTHSNTKEGQARPQARVDPVMRGLIGGIDRERDHHGDAGRHRHIGGRGHVASGRGGHELRQSRKCEWLGHRKVRPILENVERSCVAHPQRARQRREPSTRCGKQRYRRACGERRGRLRARRAPAGRNFLAGIGLEYPTKRRPLAVYQMRPRTLLWPVIMGPHCNRLASHSLPENWLASNGYLTSRRTRRNRRPRCSRRSSWSRPPRCGP